MKSSSDMEQQESVSNSEDQKEPLLPKDENTYCFGINKALLPLKIVLVSWGAGLASLLPYVTVHLRERGLTVAETTVIYTIQPVLQLMGPAVAGMIADKIGKYKPVLFVSLLLTIASATGVLFIPRAPPSECSSFADLVSCGRSAPHVRVYSEDCVQSYNGSLRLSMSQCQQYCPLHITGTENSTTQLCFTGDSNQFCSDIYLNSTQPADPISVQLGPLLEGNPFCKYPIRAIEWKGITVSNVEHARCNDLGDSCELSCRVQNATKNPNEGLILTYPCNQDWKERITTVAPALVFVLMYFMFFNVSYRLLDVTAMVMANNHGSHLGREKIWEVTSTAIFSPLAGYVVDAVSKDKDHIEYDAAFHMSNAFTALTAIFVVVLRINVAPPSKNMWGKAIAVLRQPHALIFVMAVLCMGAIWGFVIQFLAWFLAELNSDALLIGLSRTVGGVMAVPVLLSAKWWISLIGEVNIIIVAFLLYVVRCVGYSFLINPWWYLLYDSLKSVTENLMWVAALTYAASLAPPGLLATFQGFIGGVHFGIGKGVGSMIGGAMDYYGARVTFRAVGIASGVVGLLYALMHYVVLPCFKVKLKDSDERKDCEKPDECKRSYQETEDEPDSTTPLLAKQKSVPSGGYYCQENSNEGEEKPSAPTLERHKSLHEDLHSPFGSPLPQ